MIYCLFTLRKLVFMPAGGRVGGMEGGEGVSSELQREPAE